MAIDGNNETRSITAANDNNAWWMAELEKSVRIVNISIMMGTYYFNQGRYNTFKVETGSQYFYYDGHILLQPRTIQHFRS